MHVWVDHENNPYSCSLRDINGVSALAALSIAYIAVDLVLILEERLYIAELF